MITRLNNNALTSITALPSAVSNSPYFFTAKTSHQTVSRGTWVKVNGFTDSTFNSSDGALTNGERFTVPSGKAGLYQFHSNMMCDFATIGGDGEQVQAGFYKNGSQTNQPYTIHGLESNIGNMNLNFVSKQITQVMNLSVGDYIELYVNIADANGGDARVKQTVTNFSGYKLI